MWEEVDLNEWKKWRSRTLLFFYFVTFYIGLLYSGYLSTELLYIKEIVDGKHAVTYYSVGLGISCFIALLSVIVGSIYYDFTLDVKRLSVIVGFLVLIGNVLYVLPYSVWLVVTGIALIYTAIASIAALIAELTHIVEEENLTRIISIVGMCKSIGVLAGPCLAFVFVKVDVTVGKWRLFYGNMPGIVIGSLGVPVVIGLCFIKNLAKLYDLKADAQSKKRLLDDVDEREEKSDKLSLEEPSEPRQTFPKYFSTVRKIITGRHYTIILLTSTISVYTIQLVLNMITVIAVQMLQWEVVMIAYSRLAVMLGGVLFLMVPLIFSKYVKDFVLFYLTVVAVVIPIFVIAVLPQLYARPDVQKGMLFAISFLTGGLEMYLHVSSIAITAKLVRSEYQGIAEAVRQAVFYIGYTLSSFSVSPMYTYLTVSSCIVVAANVFSAVLLLFEVKYFMSRGEYEYET